jgi:beta-1,4-mannooligosaccharide/beta-1,4-mannosyl-N-acetylglucosamine phosphorylase
MESTKRATMEPESYIEQARELFVREPSNPILKASDMPFPCKAVCNPAACVIGNDILLLLRVIDDKDRSHLYVARSSDGIGNWRIETTPLLSPDLNAAWYDDCGCEDPRITYLEERREYVITYIGFSRYGAGVCLATTSDFASVTRLGMAIHPYNKDAALFPRKIGGKYQMLHRPTAGPLEDIWISESDDLVHWGNPRCVLEEADQPGWDSGKVGTGPPPREIPAGWLLIFHGVKPVDDSWEYRFGLAILDKDDPSKVVKRWPEWVFGPQEPYEMRGSSPGVVFPTGLVEKDDSLFLYYGAADTTVALATAKRELLHQFREEMEAAS